MAGVIIHGRTREQGFKGRVNRDGIRAVVEAVEGIPVVANGDIRSIDDAASMFAETGCAASRSVAGRWPTRFSSVSSTTGCAPACPARTRRTTSGWT